MRESVLKKQQNVLSEKYEICIQGGRMKVSEMIEELKKIQNQEAELILAFDDGVDTTDYAFIEDNTAYSDYVYLTVTGSLDKSLC